MKKAALFVMITALLYSMLACVKTTPAPSGTVKPTSTVIITVNPTDEPTAEPTQAISLSQKYGFFPEMVASEYPDYDFYRAVLEGNPIEAAFEKEEEKVSDIASTCDLYTDFADIWSAEMDNATDTLCQLLEAEEKAALIKAQESWKKYRENNDSIRCFAYSGFEGSMWSVEACEKRLKEYRNRTLQLLDYWYAIEYNRYTAEGLNTSDIKYVYKYTPD